MAFAFHPGLGFVIHGGISGPTALGDTWSFDGRAWTNFSGQGPSPRADHAAAHHISRATTLLFGGRHANGSMLGDTWAFAGNAWQLVATTGPSPRSGHAMCHDLARNSVLLYGGRSATAGTLSDTWEWNGSAWTKHAVTGPGPLTAPSLAYDAERRVVVLRSYVEGASFQWDGRAWTPLRIENATNVLTTPLVSDMSRGVLLALGGVSYAQVNGALLVWQLATCARHEPFGMACSALGHTPSLDEPAGFGPRIGTTSRLVLDDLVPAQAGLLVLGRSRALWGNALLPLDLAPVGMPSCSLFTSIDASVPFASSATGVGTIDLAVPLVPSLLNLSLYEQGVVGAPAANAAGMLVTNALTARIGQ